MFSLENFCGSLYGLTEGEILARCEERAMYFKGLDRASVYRGKKHPEYDYVGYVESIEKLERYLFGSKIAKLSDAEKELFDEVIKHMREQGISTFNGQ